MCTEDQQDADDARSARMWTKEESRVWLVSLMTGTSCLYAARMAMPICAVALSKEQAWNKAEIGTVLSSFFWGYCLTQIIGGYLSDKVGGAKVLGLSAIGWTLLTVAYPYLVRMFSDRSVVFLVAVFWRVIIGCFQGVHYPSMSSILARHVSEDDRAFSFAVAGCGSHVGSLLAGSIGSVLLEKYGWVGTFQVIGVVGLAWLIVFRTYVAERQSVTHRRPHRRKLSEVEDPKAMEQGAAVPWRAILSSMAFWSLIVAHFCLNYAFFIIFSWLPTYFHDNYPDAKGWVFNVVPWATCIACSLLSGVMADKLVKQGFSATFVRKVMATISVGGPAVFLLCLCLTSTFEGALLCMAAAVGCVGFHNSGILVNPQDIAPKYSGSVFGIMNTAGAIPGFVGVYIAGHILDLTGSWTVVFTTTSVVCMFGCVSYLVFGTAKQIV